MHEGICMFVYVYVLCAYMLYACESLRCMSLCVREKEGEGDGRDSVCVICVYVRMCVWSRFNNSIESRGTVVSC